MNLFVSLKYLVALDDHRHFGRAALACNVTQPALSNALKSLEENLGTAIITRGRSFAGFTSEGERVLLSARRIIREHELLQQDLHSTANYPRGHLLIGAIPTAVPVAARFAAMLQHRHPGIMPTVRSMSSVELEAGLESLALDMGLGYTERIQHGRTKLRVLDQYSEQYYLLNACPGGTGVPLRIGTPISWANAAELPLCLLSADMHNRTIIERAFEAAGVHPTPSIETNSITPLALTVVAGNVCSIMPGALVSVVQTYPGLEARPLFGPHVEVPISFIVPDIDRSARSLQAALAFAIDPLWLEHLALHSGDLAG